jgi:hypothetical protein
MITYFLSLFWIYVCLHMLCKKGYIGKQVWGRHTAMRERNLIRKVINQGPRTTKWPPLYASSPHALSTVRFEPNTLYFHMFHFPYQTELKIT